MARADISTPMVTSTMAVGRTGRGRALAPTGARKAPSSRESSAMGLSMAKESCNTPTEESLKATGDWTREKEKELCTTPPLISTKATGRGIRGTGEESIPTQMEMFSRENGLMAPSKDSGLCCMLIEISI